ncbi:Os12g0145933 [Oryza sativa Japonica Group]|uniref:Os12g0145933 protein n=1 Tax=Oryza sativa subsp. japonica TaxID=39947 RepID=A0A0P0Y6X6_ORYSJ|nr:Os12g0145933 [Oryza sativa Japonica Group]
MIPAGQPCVLPYPPTSSRLHLPLPFLPSTVEWSAEMAGRRQGGNLAWGPRLAPCLETTVTWLVAVMKRLLDFNPCAPLESQQYTGQGPERAISWTARELDGEGQSAQQGGALAQAELFAGH